ncbi:MAG: hypothetical protein LUK37_03635 [Clostridia bacterium]|nr:hypothetical protein [Clostridia bacterium]
MIQLDPSVKNLPYERLFEGEGYLKDIQPWYEYKDGEKTEKTKGQRCRLFYPEIEKSIWVKVVGKISVPHTDKLPSVGILVKPLELHVSLYATNRGGVDFSATATDIVQANSTEADEDLLL